ncbi:hypothetical protein KP814_32170 [Hahella sp. HN01]|nr:hypothetical protein [Hahella sp. HN01]
MKTMTLTITRTPRTLIVGGISIEVEELGVRLPFARKPVDLSEVGGYGQHRIYVTETREMTTIEFDVFTNHLSARRDWLRGKGGSVHGGELCIEVTAPGRPYLYINPDHGDYPRYVARLG